MSRVKICPKCGSIAEWDSYFGGTRCTRCDFVERPKPSNADRIRAMTDEELAQWIAGIYPDCPPGFSPAPLGCDDVCAECWLEWLKGEA